MQSADSTESPAAAASHSVPPTEQAATDSGAVEEPSNYGDTEDEAVVDTELNAAETPATKKKVWIKRMWHVLETFKCSDSVQEEIDSGIRRIAKEEIDKAGPWNSVIKKCSKDLEGWKYAHQKDNADKSKTKTYRCPFNYLCGCTCQIRIIHHPNEKFVIERHGEHDMNSHANDKSKCLKIAQRAAIKTAVNVNPLEKTSKIRNSIVPATIPKKSRKRLSDSVRRAVKSERTTMSRVLLDGVNLDGTFSSLQIYADTRNLKTILKLLIHAACSDNCLGWQNFCTRRFSIPYVLVCVAHLTGKEFYGIVKLMSLTSIFLTGIPTGGTAHSKHFVDPRNYHKFIKYCNSIAKCPL